MGRPTKYVAKTCEHCHQTLDYAMPLDRGSALIVLAIANAVRRKGVNRVHVVNDMEGRLSDFGVNRNQAWHRMVEEGYMTGTMRSNVARPRYHGLIAFADKRGVGTYLLTKKGASFLQNIPVPRVALIDKTTGHQAGYWDEGGMTTITQLLGGKITWNVRATVSDLHAKLHPDQPPLPMPSPVGQEQPWYTRM
jgi:hypothetical protein